MSRKEKDQVYVEVAFTSDVAMKEFLKDLVTTENEMDKMIIFSGSCMKIPEELAEEFGLVYYDLYPENNL